MLRPVVLRRPGAGIPSRLAHGPCQINHHCGPGLPAFPRGTVTTRLGGLEVADFLKGPRIAVGVREVGELNPTHVDDFAHGGAPA